jgi:hypothetical protein
MIPASQSPTAAASVTSLPTKLTNIFVSPSFVFEEIASSPPRVVNWLVPIILVCLTSLLLLNAANTKEIIAEKTRALTNAEIISPSEAENVVGSWRAISVAATCVGVVAGTVWSAAVLWLMGRWFLKSPFPFHKALEVVGLSGMILVLGAVTNIALIGAAGDAAVRPSLSFLAGRLPEDNTLRSLLDVLNLFYLWTLVSLTIGLSRLSGVTLREAGFWVVGYWLVVRVSLILLA